MAYAAAAAQKMVEYAALEVGVCIEGKLLTGQETDRTTLCPKCGRVGLLTRGGGTQPQVVIHAGRVVDGLLEGIDKCQLAEEAPSGVSPPSLSDTKA